MKNRTLKLTIVALMMSWGLSPVLAVAQEENRATDDNVTEARPVRRQRPQRSDTARHRMDPAKMAEMRTRQMTKKYGLDEAQSEKLLSLHREQMKNMGRPQRGNRVNPREMTEEQRAQMKKERTEREAAYDAAIKGILTDKQYKQYLKDKKNKQGREGFGRPNGPRGGNQRPMNGEAPQESGFDGGNADNDF